MTLGNKKVTEKKLLINLILFYFLSPKCRQCLEEEKVGTFNTFQENSFHLNTEYTSLNLKAKS